MSLAKRFRNWLREFPREPADRLAMAHAAVNAYAACQPKYRLRAEHLAPVVRAARSPYKIVYETGCRLLVDLAVAMRSDSALQCILDMATDKNAMVRLHAIQYLERDLPYKLRVEIIGLALADRSPRVRLFGVDRALDNNLKCFVPQLLKMQRTEKNKRVQEVLAFDLPLLRDGYFVRPGRHSDGYEVTVHKRTGAIISTTIPKEKYSKALVRRTIAQLKRMP